MPRDTLARRAFDVMTSSTSLYAEWFQTVKLLLSFLYLDMVFENPDSLSMAKFSTMCSDRLNRMFAQQWAAKLSDNESEEGKRSKLKFYRLFKTSFSKEA